MKINREKIAMIHVAKKQLGMSEEEYRAMLSGFGVASSKDIHVDQGNDVYWYLKRLGFRAVHRSGVRSGMHKQPARGKEALTSKVEALLSDMNLNWGYADALAKRICKVERFRFVPQNQIYKIITALVKKQQKLKKEEDK